MADATVLDFSEKGEWQVATSVTKRGPLHLRQSLPPLDLTTWHAVCCFLLLVPALFSTGGQQLSTEADGLPFVALVISCNLTAFAVGSRLARAPTSHPVRVFAASASVAATVALLVAVAARIEYSATYLLCSYLLALGWTVASRPLRLLPRPRLAVVPGGMARELDRLPEADWLVLRSPIVTDQVDGLVADLNERLAPPWSTFVAECGMRGIPLYHAGRVYEVFTGRTPLRCLSPSVLATLEHRYPRGPYMAVKRAADLVVTVLLSPIVLPLALLTAIAVKLDSEGPALFAQERVGLNGKPFKMLKFRSMRVAPMDGRACFVISEEARITRVGRFIRHFRLDELPQFWNVVWGDMSLIGPRPEQIPFVQQYEDNIPYYGYRHMVRPGITGWAQVNQGYAAGADETRLKLEHDLFYARHQCLWLDLAIVWRTVLTIISGFGAR